MRSALLPSLLLIKLLSQPAESQLEELLEILGADFDSAFNYPARQQHGLVLSMGYSG
jgi:hypothetical protein